MAHAERRLKPPSPAAAYYGSVLGADAVPSVRHTQLAPLQRTFTFEGNLDAAQSQPPKNAGKRSKARTPNGRRRRRAKGNSVVPFSTTSPLSGGRLVHPVRGAIVRGRRGSAPQRYTSAGVYGERRPRLMPSGEPSSDAGEAATRRGGERKLSRHFTLDDLSKAGAGQSSNGTDPRISRRKSAATYDAQVATHAAPSRRRRSTSGAQSEHNGGKPRARRRSLALREMDARIESTLAQAQAAREELVKSTVAVARTRRRASIAKGTRGDKIIITKSGMPKLVTREVVTTSSHEESIVAQHRQENKAKGSWRSMCCTKQTSAAAPSAVCGRWLFLGDQDDASRDDELMNLGISYILCSSKQGVQHFPESFVYLKLPLLDLAEFDIAQYFEQSNKFIHRCRENDCRILVHCLGGTSRAATLVIAYLVAKQDMRLDHAITQVWRSRPFVNPNPGFKFALAKYEVGLRGTTSVYNHPWYTTLFDYKRQRQKWRRASLAGVPGEVCCVLQ